MHRFPLARFFPFAFAAALLLSSTPTAAQSVPRLSGQITDEAGVVGGGRGSLEAALADLLTTRNVQLYALFVRTTSGEDPAGYAKATFEQNALGGNDFLIVVAVDDRRFAWWEESAVPSLTSTDIDQLLSKTAEAPFRVGDYAGGVAAFAKGLSDELAATPAPTAAPTSPPSGGGVTPSSGSDNGFLLALVGVILVLGGLVLLWTWWQRRRASRLSAEERDRRTGQLARDANSLLIQADDAVREADQELGFAEAQFDDADVAPLRAAIDISRTQLKAAFAVRQQLDDATPEDPPTKERMLGEIVERSRGIVGSLAEQHKRIQGLREQEQAAPQTIAGLPARIAALEARVPTATEALEHLHTYAPAMWKPVDGNVAEAEKRLASARDEATAGSAALAQTPPRTTDAAAAARRGERALAEAGDLLAAIDRLVSSVDDARSRLEPELAAAEQDLKAAQAAADSKGMGASFAARIAEANGVLARARQAAAAPNSDVIGALKDAQTAHLAADAILAGERDAEAQLARQRAALESALRTADASVAGAGDFIAARRQGVGREARTRLATAQSHLETAHGLAATDPARAVDEAGIADRAAAEAYRLAQSDFDEWDRPRRAPGGDLGQAILGGIILGNVLGGMGGGRGGGGWGGTPWGMPGGGGMGGSGGFGGAGSIGGGRGGSGSW